MSQHSLRFRDLGVSERIADALSARSIEEPFEIQRLVLPDALPEGILTAAQRVCDAVVKVGRERWERAPVTASVGVTMARPEDDVTTLLRRADGEAYAAKRAGGNQVALGAHLLTSRSGIVPAPDSKRRTSHG